MTDPQQGLPYPPAGSTPARRTNALAVVSLVAGLCGFTIVPLLGSIVAVLTGHLALGQIRVSGEEGATLAKAGLWLGYVAIALGAIALIGVLGFIVVRSTT